MTHEGRCIEFPCTCVTILRERIVFLEMNSNIFRNEWQLEREKRKSLENKIKDGLSCCCSGCTRHNLILAGQEEIGKDKLTVKYD